MNRKCAVRRVRKNGKIRTPKPEIRSRFAVVSSQKRRAVQGQIGRNRSRVRSRRRRQNRDRRGNSGEAVVRQNFALASRQIADRPASKPRIERRPDRRRMRRIGQNRRKSPVALVRPIDRNARRGCRADIFDRHRERRIFPLPRTQVRRRQSELQNRPRDRRPARLGQANFIDQNAARSLFDESDFDPSRACRSRFWVRKSRKTAACVDVRKLGHQRLKRRAQVAQKGQNSRCRQAICAHFERKSQRFSSRKRPNLPTRLAVFANLEAFSARCGNGRNRASRAVPIRKVGFETRVLKQIIRAADGRLCLRNGDQK